ncbi:hypothetical protein Acr_00g0062470 [Actinidia rufa]|uniref:Uncharacterized protein n=1 Tax=Actinidia rufa TaxID=165716 RepID=A0A7J0DP72_9ERIC|nr:hypothetical protein Acr_00g0062470 [Actinidia rufa]
MADGTRSQDFKKLEDSFQILKEQQVNSAKETAKIKNTLVEVKEFMAAVTFKYDQVAAHVYGKQHESVPGGSENQGMNFNQFRAEYSQSQSFPGFGTRTMRVHGLVKKQKVVILIDTGSTHNFLNQEVVERAGVETVDTDPLTAFVVDGTKMISCVACKDFKWEMQGAVFQTDMRVLELKGCDMVLGIQ